MIMPLLLEAFSFIELLYMTTKKCCKCKTETHITKFYKNRCKKDGLDTLCKVCRNIATALTTKNKPNEQKARHLKSRLKIEYGITPEDFNRMLLEQDNKCASCGKTTEENVKRLCVDHDHITGRVRALLCDDCNVALGRLNDNADKAKAILAYILSYC